MNKRLIILLAGLVALAAVSALAQTPTSVPAQVVVEPNQPAATVDFKKVDDAFKKGQYAQMEPFCKEVLKTKASDPEAVYQAQKRLPPVYLAAGKQAEARAAVEQLLTQSAKHERLPHALQDIVDQAELLKKVPQIGEIYQDILAAKPDRPDAIWLKMGIAVADAHLKNDQAVDAILQDIISKYRDDERSTEALGQVAWAYRKLEQHDKARTVYRYVVDNWPKRDRTVFSLRGVVLSSIALNDQATADAGLQKLTTDYADSKYMAEIMRNIAGEYYRKGKLEQARAVHQYVVDKHPKNLEALWCQRDIVFCYLDAKNNEAAEAAVSKLVTDFASQPRLAEALADVGEYYRKKGNLQTARAVHQQVVTKFPNSSEAIMSERNAILSSMGLKDDAQTEAGVQTLMTQFAKDKDIVPILGYVADRLGEGKEAQRATLYQHIIDTYPQHEMIVRVKAKLAQVKILQGDEASGEAIVRKVLTDYPNHPRLPEAVRLLGEAYFIKGLKLANSASKQAEKGTAKVVPEAADRLLRKAVATWAPLIAGASPSDLQAAEAQLCTIVAYSQLGEHESTLEQGAKLVQQWPEYAYTWQAYPLMVKAYKEQVRAGKITPEKGQTAIDQLDKQLIERYPASPAAVQLRKALQNSEATALSRKSNKGGEQ